MPDEFKPREKRTTDIAKDGKVVNGEADRILEKESHESREKIVRHNLKMLKSDMLYQLNKESFGGNAGTVKIDGKKYSCGAANGYFEPQTGKIVAFGNPQDVDKDVRRNKAELTFVVALVPEIGGFGEIVDYFIGYVSLDAEKNIKKAIDQYNIEIGDKRKNS